MSESSIRNQERRIDNGRKATGRKMYHHGIIVDERYSEGIVDFNSDGWSKLHR